MNLYSRALRHIDMKDVKEKYERKVIEKKMVEESEKKYNKFISSLVEERRYDWRKEMSDNNVEVKEEIIIDDSKISKYNWREKIAEDRKKYFEEGMTTSGMVYTTLGATGDTEYPAIELSTTTVSFPGYRDAARVTYDTSYYNELVLDITVSGDEFFGFYVLDDQDNMVLFTQSSGTYSFPVRQSSNLELLFNVSDSGDGTVTINDSRFRRTTPLNVFVSLDSPEASAFIRTDPIMANLSPQERQQKLKEMLEASDEYLFKLFGSDFPGSGAVPPGESGETPGVEIASLPTEIAQGQTWTDDPSTWPSIKNPVRTAPAIIDPKTGWPSVPNVPPSYRGKPGGQQVRMAHYKPEGQIISEKKKLKSPQEILNKIPGYYDGKPAPLGFPEVPPPKMVNGMHPDLVDGKKIANRFNRLDPESARAMPSTGNPYIDKKVKSAAKKPK